MLELRDQYLSVIAVILAVLLLLILVRAIIGPTITDRIMSVNMMGTIVMVQIGILAVKKNEGYLVDVALIYALISFLAVVVFARVYLGVYNEKMLKKRMEDKVKDVTEGEE